MARPYGIGAEFTCNQCGRVFRDRPSRCPSFCSLDCYNDWIAAPPEVRFFRHLSNPTESGCILWTANKNRLGYGVLCVKAKLNTRILAHRLAWTIANGPIPDNMYILHRCDNPPCVNVQHLFIGTRADNNKDMRDKQRHTRGAKSPHAKLTDDDVRDIRTLCASGRFSQQSLADKYGVSQQQIHKIVKRLRWSHVD